jgi:hypothetical protein
LKWYWRQVISSIAMLWVDAIRTHKWLAVRAILTGWVVWAVFFVTRQIIDGIFLPAQWAVVATAVIRYCNWFVIGYVVGALHRPHAAAMVLAYAGFTIIMSMPAVSQSVVALFGHPNYNAPPPSMVLIAVVSLIAGGLFSSVRFRRSDDGHPRRPRSFVR